MDPRALTDAELDAAIDAIADPARLKAAQDLVMRTAPALGRVLQAALEQGGWFGPAHDQALREATAAGDHAQRVQDVRALLAEETRLGMFVGVAVGIGLARELDLGPAAAPDASAAPAGGDPAPGDRTQT